MEPITIDFETEAIDGNPIINPPKPVGVAVWVPGQEPAYLAWGHPSENNCSFSDAHQYLRNILDSNHPLLFHNAGFDISVWESSFCNAPFPWHKTDMWRQIHDTMFLLFLADPYSSTLSLKPCADRYLGMAATEQEELQGWIIKNINNATRKNAGAFISLAPGDIVGRYAIGDVVRTRKLFDLLHDRITKDGMESAYDRERHLFPITLASTRRGIRINRDTLSHHEYVYTECLKMGENLLCQHLHCNDTAIHSDESLADALDKAGAVKEWILTKTGKRSMSKDNLKILDPQVKILLDYRSALATCLQTFMRPWLEFSANDGRLHPNWNQVKQYREGGGIWDKKGTQTGRLSSDTPNFQNVPTEFVSETGEELSYPEGLHPLPKMRQYCLPEENHVWLKRDFASQEIRILAHFEDGSLCKAYQINPALDPHQMARELMHSLIGILYARKDTKITAFSIIYGTGNTGLSLQLGRPYHEAAQIKTAYLAAMPSIRDLMYDVQSRGRSGQPIRTWGGRLYYAEPSKVIDGRLREFSYKLLNYLIQGSAADQTKESIIAWEAERSWDVMFLATVHDEINISVPKDEWQSHMEILKKAMEMDRFDVPMLTDGFIGENWHELVPDESNNVGTMPVEIQTPVYRQDTGHALGGSESRT